MMNIPEDVKNFLANLISECNNNLSKDLSTFPSTHEESLDLNFISHFAQNQGPLKFGSGWILRFDAHYIGGGRHYRNWEVADLGLMIIFRKNGKTLRSKLAFLQSKKLYANSVKYQPHDPFYRMGMGRLLQTEDEHNELINPRTLKFKEGSKYKAFKVGNEQQKAMSAFASGFDVKMYYLFYNPSLIPWSINMPIEQLPIIPVNKVGCRVIPKQAVDNALKEHEENYTPSYGDIKYLLEHQFSNEHIAGWRLEHFIVDLLIGCKEGLVDDSPNFETMVSLFEQKSNPISSALSITFDINE